VDPQLHGDGDGFDNVVVHRLEIDDLDYRLGLAGVSPSTLGEHVEHDAIAVKELLQTGASDVRDDDDLSLFVSTYSRINILCNEKLAKAWQQFEGKVITWGNGPALYSAIGNSRHSPTPWLFICGKSQVTSIPPIIKCAVTAHESICTEEFIMISRDSKLEHPTSLVSGKIVKGHKHKLQPKPCPFGCDPETQYQSEKTLQSHNRISIFCSLDAYIQAI
jgi:hypothetical protein